MLKTSHLALTIFPCSYAGGARKVFDAAYYAQPAAKALVEDHKKVRGSLACASLAYVGPVG